MADLKARLKNFIGFTNTAEDYNVFDEYDDEEEEMVLENEEFSVTTKDQYERASTKSAETRTSVSTGVQSGTRSAERGKVLNMGMNSSLRVVLSKPTAFANCEAVCSHLRGNMTVVLNLEYVSNTADRKRIFDFVSGCCFALDCTIQRVSDLIYVIAPSHVDVLAEIGDEVESTETQCMMF